MEMADKKYLHDLIKLHKKINGIDYCIIGGAAVKEYGFNRTTEDIDILVNKNDEQRLYKNFKTYNLNNLSIGGIGIDVLFSGERVSDKCVNFLPPKDIKIERKNLPFISLPYLIFYKIDSGINNIERGQDIVDAWKLVQYNKLPEDYLDEFDNQFGDIINRYKQIWKEVKKFESTFENN